MLKPHTSGARNTPEYDPSSSKIESTKQATVSAMRKKAEIFRSIETWGARVVCAMLRCRTVRAPAPPGTRRAVQRTTIAPLSGPGARCSVSSRILRAVAPTRGYAKAARSSAAQAAPAVEDVSEQSSASTAEEDEKDKKQQVVPGPVPLSFWYTSDKEYIDENFMRTRDLYRVATLDLQEAVRLRAKEFELHLDEFKRRIRLPSFLEYIKVQQRAAAEYRPVRGAPESVSFFSPFFHRSD